MKGDRSQMISNKQRENARAFWERHQEKKLLVLPNAWDVGSARIFEKQGFKAVATTSAGVAHSMGYADGENLAFDELLYLVKRITSRIGIPLSVDFERGFGESGKVVKENARQLLYAGAVGFNLEDGLPQNGELSSVGLQTEKIRALRELKEELNLGFVINARTCAYLLNVSENNERLQIATQRGNAYLEAGADCVFVPGTLDENIMIALIQGIHGPVNILLTDQSYDFKRLEEIGVRRLSIGSALSRWSYGKVIDLAGELGSGNTAEMRSNWFTLRKADDYFRQ